MAGVFTAAPWARKGETGGPQAGQIPRAQVPLVPGPSVMSSEVPADVEENVVTPKGFRTPDRRIRVHSDLDHFLRSREMAHFERWLRGVNDSVVGKKLTDAIEVSANAQAMIGVLDTLGRWIDEIPPIQQPMRYGNKAFRTWHKKVKDNARQVIEAVLPVDLKEAAVELGVYLVESIGNATRIDYGTGHELAFVALLYCAEKVGYFAAADAPALVLRVFAAYIALMRRVQQTYLLEPAGSHGVWSLDDYQFLPFYFGAAQLRGNESIPPSAVRDQHMAKSLKVAQHIAANSIHLSDEDWYVITGAREDAHTPKGPFAEHSPILNDISAVKTWEKVNSGMLSMYKAEVLGKFPVMQHFRFGSIFDWKSPSLALFAAAQAKQAADNAAAAAATATAAASTASDTSTATTTTSDANTMHDTTQSSNAHASSE